MFDYWWIYALVGFIFLYVLAQSIVALFKSMKHAKKLGFSSSQINKTITSSAILSVAPSIAILISLVLLSQVFGPWIAGMRLGTLGAVTYELPAHRLVGTFAYPGDCVMGDDFRLYTTLIISSFFL